MWLESQFGESVNRKLILTHRKDLLKGESSLMIGLIMLPKVFDGYSIDEIEGMLSEIENIDDGGAALTAYGKFNIQICIKWKEKNYH